MEPKDVISSGMLESYVLGTASAEEIQVVHALMAKHPELLMEIEAIEKSLIAAAEADAPEVPAGLKEDLLKKLQENESVKEGRIIPLQKPNATETGSYSPLYKYGIAASVTLLIGSTIANVIMYNRLHDVQEQVAQLNNEKSVLASQMQVSKASLQEAQNSLAFVSDTMVKPVHLKPMPHMPASSAMVYWNSRSKEVYLNVTQLPAPPAGKQYQLWALEDGKPVDAGVFNVVDTIRLQKLKDISQAQAFAVTLEKEGGSASPTMSEMYMMGTLQ